MKRDETRERRITMDIIVDAYTPEEQAMGWYYYLEDHLRFPFRAKCAKRRPISPLKVGNGVEVVSMAPEEECEHEMFVNASWNEATLAVPLSQLVSVKASKKIRQAMDDWHYWVAMGYEL